MTDKSTQGRLNRQRGLRWMNRIARDISVRTGLEIKRQLLEVREGNLGDVEIHERLPFVLEAKNEEDPSVWAALEQANEVAQGRGLYPIAVIQKRDGRGPIPHTRVVGWYLEDWKELAATLADFGLMRLCVSVKKTGQTYPRVWTGLEEASEEAAEPQYPDTAMPVAIGTRENGQDVALQRYDDFLWMVTTAIRNDIW